MIEMQLKQNGKIVLNLFLNCFVSVSFQLCDRTVKIWKILRKIVQDTVSVVSVDIIAFIITMLQQQVIEKWSIGKTRNKWAGWCGVGHSELKHCLVSHSLQRWSSALVRLVSLPTLCLHCWTMVCRGVFLTHFISIIIINNAGISWTLSHYLPRTI